MPERHQRKRTAGWHKPQGSIIVDRTSRWGNPYKIGQDGAVVGEVRMDYRLTSSAAVWAFEHALCWGLLPFSVNDVRRELAGKDLVCFCALDQPCHATVLLRIANSASPIRTWDEIRKGYGPAIRAAS
jgi:hypothetical protein